MRVIVITGPTASGKSALAVKAARTLGCEIISADSRQIYRHMPITTAVPTEEERGGVRHHLLEILEPTEYYSAARFEEDALALIADMERRGLENVVVCGGSMMYIDALLYGLDDLPTISQDIRERVLKLYGDDGIEGIRRQLKLLDPEYFETVDLNNHRRVIHAIEIIWQSGFKVSSLRKGIKKERPFTWEKYAIDISREELFERINNRVGRMVVSGMLDEAKTLLPLRGENALNTVGFKEIYAYFDGILDYDTALSRIAKNTRVYAKKQLTWLNKDSDVTFISPENLLNRMQDDKNRTV